MMLLGWASSLGIVRVEELGPKSLNQLGELLGKGKAPEHQFKSGLFITNLIIEP